MDQPKAPRTRRPHEKLARLLAAGAEVFERDGYARARVEAICEGAEVSVGTFYDHFDNKSELLLRLAQEAHEELRLPSAHELRALEEGVEALTTPAAPLTRTWLEAIRVEPALMTEHVKMRQSTLSKVVRWVGESRLRRGVRGSLSDQIAARVVLTLLKEAALADYDPLAERVRELTAAIWVVLYGDREARSTSIAGAIVQ
jgi:AcrR family transcriptional regulator